MEAINAFELPLLNTVLLLASGVTITYSHHSLIQGNRNGALLGAIFTVFLAMIFTALIILILICLLLRFLIYSGLLK
ncbi:hypothetical protein EON69_00500 [bacterium]|nr:MAG: hypothetical protein EON69_00500 [bacterium]